MKLTAGSVFILALLLIGGAGLIAGQTWAYTGSLLLGCVTGGVGFLLLLAGLRAFLKRAGAARSVRFLGEVKEDGLDVDDFLEFFEENDGPKQRVEKDVKERPDEMARSISTMLGRADKRKRK